MFTGLIQSKGALVRRTQSGADARLVLRGHLVSDALLNGKSDPIVLGESIAIDGVCLTVAKIVQAGGPNAESVFEVDASTETLEKTTLGSLAIGSSINLERALPIGGRLGGHIVSGHVDGVGVVTQKTPAGAAMKIVFEAPADLARYIAPKGSICVSGVSLTVNNVSGASGSSFDVMLIPHTLEKTSLDGISVGDRVNLEVDVLARYVARLMDVGRIEAPPGGQTRTTTDPMDRDRDDSHLLERLRASGYV
jgi:riboflavin synthase